MSPSRASSTSDLKNYSLIVRNGKVELSPAYDLLNSCIILKDPEETALPLAGHKRNLSRKDWLSYWPRERLELSEAAVAAELDRFHKAFTPWQELLEASFLPEELKTAYRVLLDERKSRLGM